MERTPINRTGKGPAERFTGDVYVTMIQTPTPPSLLSAATVRFTPGARTNWHSHDLGQTLYVTDGVGYVGTLKVRDHTEQVLIAFVTRSGTDERRLISKGYATVAPTGAGSESEESLGSKSFEATIFPNGSQELWYVYKGVSL